jgi:type I restriction enzyme S subunit
MFYREVNFKGTEIGRIPKDWEVSKLEKICEKIKAGGTPLTTKKEFWNGDIPFVKIVDMTSSGKYLMKTSSFITKVGLENSNAWLVPENSLLLAMYGSLGEVSINTIDVATNQAILGIIPKEKDDVEFLYYWFLYFKPCWRRFAKPTTQANLTAEIVRNSTLPLPSPQERRKIVEILSTVDEAIQKTNEIIAKTERLKKGLMQELLTKGIGHKEFKDTEVGRIPKDWEVEKLGNKEFAEIIMGQSPPSSTYNREGKGLLFLQGKMEFGDIHPSPILYCSQPIKIAEPNDILISVRAPVGDVNIARYRLCIGRGLAAIRFNLNRASHWFYFYYFQKIKNFLENLGKGSTFKAITKEDLENLKVPYPSFFEQQRIAEVLFTIDKKLEVERNEKAKLERIKQGLMDLLLTGKVRVR